MLLMMKEVMMEDGVAESNALYVEEKGAGTVCWASGLSMRSASCRAWARSCIMSALPCSEAMPPFHLVMVPFSHLILPV